MNSFVNSFSVTLQVFHNCVLVGIHGLEAHLVSQEDTEEEEAKHRVDAELWVEGVRQVYYRRHVRHAILTSMLLTGHRGIIRFCHFFLCETA